MLSRCRRIHVSLICIFLVSEIKRQGGGIKKILQQGCGWLKRLPTPLQTPWLPLKSALTSLIVQRENGKDYCHHCGDRAVAYSFWAGWDRSIRIKVTGRAGYHFDYLLFAKTVIRHCRKLFNSQGQKLEVVTFACVSLSAWYFGCSHMCILFWPVCCMHCCAAFIFLFVI